VEHFSLPFAVTEQASGNVGKNELAEPDFEAASKTGLRVKVGSQERFFKVPQRQTRPCPPLAESLMSLMSLIDHDAARVAGNGRAARLARAPLIRFRHAIR